MKIVIIYLPSCWSRQLQYPIDFHCICCPIMNVSGVQQLYGYDISWFVSIRKKETHTGLEQHEAEDMMTTFLDELSF